MTMSAALIFVITFLTLALILAVFGLCQKNTNVICKSKKRLDGKTAIVTGGTSGMGLEIATDFAARGARVIIACPFFEEGTKAEKYIIENTDNDKIIFKLLNLASLNSVRGFAKDILNTEERLDILMNNAGVGIGGDSLTADGMHITMQINYFGHFLLTLLLLPLLKKTGKPREPSRVVNTSSHLHRIGRIDFENLNRIGYWYPIQVYGNSKICLISFSREFSKRMIGANVVMNSVDPGAVGTRIFDQIGWVSGNLITFIYGSLLKRPWDGAQTGIHVALDPKAGEITGEYFKDCSLYSARKSAYDDKTAQMLWEESVRLVKLSDDEIEKCFKSL